MISVETDDLYQDYKNHFWHYMDTSNFPSDGPLGFLHSTHNKAVPAKFKDECVDKVAKSFVGLKAKMYSILQSDNTIKRACKGVPRNVAATYTHDKYRDVLHNNVVVNCETRQIESLRHELYIVHRKKMAMNSFDDKRYAITNTHSLAYGHHLAETIHAEVRQRDLEEEAARNTAQGVDILRRLEDEDFAERVQNLQDPL
jgi:hypothetical protein